ncbi:MAG: aromatic ring-hydroxylating oxygenase subunit alpha [Algiphilus sp.]
MDDWKAYEKHPQEGAGNPNKVQELLAEEPVPVPDRLRSYPADLGDEPLDTSRYTSRAFHDREMQKLWPKVWQFACREEQILEPGKHVLYEIGERSVIIMRGSDHKVRAFYNACMHRGRALRNGAGTVGEIRCPFHGFTWDVNGGFKSLPCAWDFKHLEGDKLHLPQLRCETWGGFVFVNFDDNAPPLSEQLRTVMEHFKDYGFERSCTLVHVQKRIPCNWKVGQEAFFESMHSRTTHPHILSFIADVDTQYDIIDDYTNRMITPSTVPSSHLVGISEDQVLHDALMASGRMASSEADKHQLPEGQDARTYIGEMNRQMFADMTGMDLSEATYCELQDAILYAVFPNIQIWAGYFGNIVYRFIPDGDDHEHCIFDVRVLGRHKPDEPCPKAPPVNRLGDDEPFENATELAALGTVFDQDMGNLPAMTKGLKSSGRGQIQLAHYQETRIRHHHRTLDRYLES